MDVWHGLSPDPADEFSSSLHCARRYSRDVSVSERTEQGVRVPAQCVFSSRSPSLSFSLSLFVFSWDILHLLSAICWAGFVALCLGLLIRDGAAATEEKMTTAVC